MMADIVEAKSGKDLGDECELGGGSEEPPL